MAAHDERAADNLLDRIEATLDRLADHPRLGQRRSGGGAGLRSFTVPPYILLYEPIPGGIRLIRVLHGARDIGGSLGED